MNNNFYKYAYEFIKMNFKGKQRKRMLTYLNSQVFDEELELLMDKQRSANEPITREFAIECLIESQATREDDEYITTLF